MGLLDFSRMFMDRRRGGKRFAAGAVPIGTGAFPVMQPALRRLNGDRNAFANE